MKLTDTAAALCNNLIEWKCQFCWCNSNSPAFCGERWWAAHKRVSFTLFSISQSLFTANLILAEWIACETVHTAATQQQLLCQNEFASSSRLNFMYVVSFFVCTVVFHSLQLTAQQQKTTTLVPFFSLLLGCRVLYLCVTGIKSSCRIHHCLVSRTQHPHSLVLAHNHRIKRTEAIHKMPISCHWNIQLRCHALAHNTNFHHHNYIYFFVNNSRSFVDFWFFTFLFISARLLADAFSLWWIFDYETRLGKSIRLKCFIRLPQQQLAESQ